MSKGAWRHQFTLLLSDQPERSHSLSLWGWDNPDIAPSEPGLGCSLGQCHVLPTMLTLGKVWLTEPGAPSSPFPSPQWNNLPFGASPRY